MKYLKLILLSLLVGLTTGCIFDDYGNCKTSFVYFSYQGDGVRQIFDDKIQKVNLYIFDSNEQNILSRTIDKAELLQNHGLRLDFLPPGDYHIFCVGNAFTYSDINTSEGMSLDNLRISNKDILNDVEPTTNDSLYIGYKQITIPKKKYNAVNDTIKFVSAHIKIYIEVYGFPAPADSSDPQTGPNQSTLNLAINNLGGAINFQNITDPELYSYSPKFTYSTQTKMYSTQFNVFRFQEESNITIELKNQINNLLFSMRLEDFLANYPQFDLTKNEVLIGIHIDFLGEGIVAKVPDWIINNDVEPEL